MSDDTMIEFPYCQREEHIIGNPKTKKCYMTESGVPCSECIYHQALLLIQMPQSYMTKLRYIAKFAIPRFKRHL